MSAPRSPPATSVSSPLAETYRANGRARVAGLAILVAERAFSCFRLLEGSSGPSRPAAPKVAGRFVFLESGSPERLHRADDDVLFGGGGFAREVTEIDPHVGKSRIGRYER